MLEKVTARAAEILTTANATQTADERQRGESVAALIADPAAKTLSLLLTDRLFRSTDARRAAQTFRAVLKRTGIPNGFSFVNSTLLALGNTASHFLPGTVLSGVQRRLRGESDGVILPAEPGPLAAYLAQRGKAGTRVNLNQLGEAILGEGEAAKRMDDVLALLARPDVNYVSVKISAIFSQINLLAWDDTLERIKARLRTLYRAALPNDKFVNLDMEEYRDLALTMAAFTTTLDEPEFLKLRAGMVLQAYLPDSWTAQQELLNWARQRAERGGAPPKMRLVKGANLAMESVEAELRGWNPAPYATKLETDANFKRMLECGCRPENARVLRLGVGSHNLFDVALALQLREDNHVREFVEIEMLEGMANHQARAVQNAANGLLVYAPVARHDDFGSALAYLIRRLDENTAPENFLHDLFGLTPGSAAWQRQKERFEKAWAARNTVFADSRRASPRKKVEQTFLSAESGRQECLPHLFENEPDTDWTQLPNRDALWKSVRETTETEPPAPAPLQKVLEDAKRAQPGWEALGTDKRAAILRQCAEVMSAQKFRTIACVRIDGKKAITDADTEVSEAIDFARYYAETGGVPADLRAKALGIVALTPPWNFPYAIPAGGILAALVAGNAVILKPAPETVATAWLLAQQLWEGGVPRDVLQFFPCADGEIGKALITSPEVSAIILTGAYETARMFQSWRPSLHLFAETSGKNAIVVSALADRDLAIKDIVRSAFGHSGQKCSAASLAILEAEVYDSASFMKHLRDAASSLRVGPSIDPASVVTPLIRPASDSLKRAFTTLDEGEEWLLEPKQDANDPCLWSPGIKIGVKPGSWFHQTECFGPVLGVMRARDLDHALELQNAVEFGLTAGFQSLDEKEIAHWRENVLAGNLYINRAITGAIVQRQPFGGWKRSCIGPGAKAGGPNYVNMFRRLEDTASVNVEAAAKSYESAFKTHLMPEHDPSALLSESNVFRYRKCRGVILRADRKDASALDLARHAATICGVKLVVSLSTEESEAQLAARLPSLANEAEFLRTFQPPGDELLAAAHKADLNWIDAPMVSNGRSELLRWLREQSVSETLHRYGQIIRK